MKSTRLFALAAALLLSLIGARAASAQAAYTATGPGGFLAVGGTYSVFQSQYGSRVLGGSGIHVDINFTRDFGLEAEGRWLRQNQVSNTHETTYLIGPRYQHRIGRGHFMPYVKFLVGDGEFNFPYNYAKGQYFVLAPGAGLEYRVNSAIQIRVIDVEYQRWQQFTYGLITPYGVSAGVTWRVHGLTRSGYRHK